MTNDWSHKQNMNACTAPIVHLPHWGWVRYIRASNVTIIGPDNVLSPGRRQAIIWSNAGISLIWLFRTNFSEILSEIFTFLFNIMHLKMSCTKWRQFCPGLSVLKQVHDIDCSTSWQCIFVMHIRHWYLHRSWHRQNKGRSIHTHNFCGWKIIWFGSRCVAMHDVKILVCGYHIQSAHTLYKCGRRKCDTLSGNRHKGKRRTGVKLHTREKLIEENMQQYPHNDFNKWLKWDIDKTLIHSNIRVTKYKANKHFNSPLPGVVHFLFAPCQNTLVFFIF